MLNKQGLFTRNTPLSNARPSSGAPQPSTSKQDEQFVMPGHLAAIESATAASPSPSAKPAEVKHDIKHHVEAKPADYKHLDTKSTDAKAVVGSKLIVGPDVKLKGAEIQDCDTLVVEGRVEATMDSRVIHIAEKGAFSGNVGIDVAEIYGQFDGELTARGQLIIHATGRVSGKIRYGKIHIEEGGELSGDIASISNDANKSNVRPNLNS